MKRSLSVYMIFLFLMLLTFSNLEAEGKDIQFQGTYSLEKGMVNIELVNHSDEDLLMVVPKTGYPYVIKVMHDDVELETIAKTKFLHGNYYDKYELVKTAKGLEKYIDTCICYGSIDLDKKITKLEHIQKLSITVSYVTISDLKNISTGDDLIKIRSSKKIELKPKKE